MTDGQASFSSALAHIPTAVSVITTTDPDGAPWGVTIGALCSLSVRPPLILFCLDKANESHSVLTTSAWFLIHVLADHQARVAARFARRGSHRFDAGFDSAGFDGAGFDSAGFDGAGFDSAGKNWRGLPTIPEVLVRIRGRQTSLLDGGDHTIVIAQVEDVEVNEGRPLLYHERGYHGLTEVPSWAERIGAPLRVGGADAGSGAATSPLGR
jgi:flavin reductase (DIM6/NTAB) family NADH-FMN oxidoreductase RutF